MDTVAVLKDVLKDEEAVIMAVLFGSRAKGRARQGSDVDVGILWADGISSTQKDNVLDRMERAVRATADAIDLDDAPPLLRMEVAKTGVLVLARSSDAWPRFRARAMLDWWDFAPYARRMHEAARARLEAAVHGAR
jgi:uncharacterized protein